MSVRIVKGFCFVLITFLVVCVKADEKDSVTTISLVVEAGYPIEEHEVITEDGYILGIHRIPYSPQQQTQNEDRPIAIMQHGYVSSSTDWVVAGPDVALAYLLSDKGFDIWLLNSRGNKYSDRNTNISKDSFDFWKFSFHEMGIYDLPASFEYIANLTGTRKFHYFGHSQGSTDFLVLCSSLPQYNDWIKSAHLLAPVVFDANMRSLPARVLGPLFGQPNNILTSFPFNIGARSDFSDFISKILCRDGLIFLESCPDLLFTVVGYSDYFNASILPLLNQIYPEGSSDLQGLHFLQNYVSGKFRLYDYGIENQVYYQASEPPDYNLDNVSAPIYIYYSEGDFFSEQFDVLRLAVTLPDVVVKRVFKVEPKRWNHIDFLYGIGVKDLVYAQVLQDVDESLQS